MLTGLFRRVVCIFAVLIAFAGFADQQEIRVHLATQNPLQPIYVGKPHSSDGKFSSSYLQELEGILRYDLNYNGICQVIPFHADKEALSLDPGVWKLQGVLCSVKWEISAKGLKASVLSVPKGLIQHFQDIPLAGDLALDRRQIHKLADGITKAVFEQEGIAH
ncbi:MAG: hypothetical protein HYZ48_03370, partial [Chlamydiales bacterium]|nr:hypothetical protein [Chlamydiales bacterium]